MRFTAFQNWRPFVQPYPTKKMRHGFCSCAASTVTALRFNGMPRRRAIFSTCCRVLPRFIWRYPVVLWCLRVFILNTPRRGLCGKCIAKTLGNTLRQCAQGLRFEWFHPGKARAAFRTALSPPRVSTPSARLAEVKRILATGLSHAGQRNHIALLLEAADSADAGLAKFAADLAAAQRGLQQRRRAPAIRSAAGC